MACNTQSYWTLRRKCRASVDPKLMKVAEGACVTDLCNAEEEYFKNKSDCDDMECQTSVDETEDNFFDAYETDPDTEPHTEEGNETLQENLASWAEHKVIHNAPISLQVIPEHYLVHCSPTRYWSRIKLAASTTILHPGVTFSDVKEHKCLLIDSSLNHVHLQVNSDGLSLFKSSTTQLSSPFVV